MLSIDFWNILQKNICVPINSAGLFGLLLINVSKDSFIKFINFSFFWKHTSMIWSTLSLKSSSSCTISLSFSGFTTIVVPKFCKTNTFDNKILLSATYLPQQTHSPLGNLSLERFFFFPPELLMWLQVFKKWDVLKFKIKTQTHNNGFQTLVFDLKIIYI